MLGVAGILGQEIVNPSQWWYSAGMPENLPSFDGNQVNMGAFNLSRKPPCASCAARTEMARGPAADVLLRAIAHQTMPLAAAALTRRRHSCLGVLADALC
jgi:hypothetical protein